MRLLKCWKWLEIILNVNADAILQGTFFLCAHGGKVIYSLKKKKCCDPQGYINELFQHDSLGYNLKQSLLTMLNKIKDFLEIPDMMVNVNVVIIVLWIKKY